MPHLRVPAGSQDSCILLHFGVSLVHLPARTSSALGEGAAVAVGRERGRSGWRDRVGRESAWLDGGHVG
eukprot:1904072-Pyramimonas_sp.AAC.1